MEFKYIIILNGESPILFPAHLDHSSMANGFKIVSAGKVKIYPICVTPKDIPDAKNFDAFNKWADKLLYQISVTQGSVTLDIKRNPSREEEDQQIIERFLRPEY